MYFLPTSDGNTNGARLLYTYEKYGRLSEVDYQADSSTPAERISAYLFDKMGNLAYASDFRVHDLAPNQRPPLISTAQTIQYNWGFDATTFSGSSVRKLEVLPPSPSTSTIQYLYNPSDLLHRVTDPLGQKTEYTYHPTRFWLTQVTRYKDAGQTQPISSKTVYDRFGHPIEVEDPRGNKTTYVYDDFGRVIEKRSPEYAANTLMRYVYNEAGDLISLRRPENIVQLYTYDSAGRLASVTYQDASIPQRSWPTFPNLTYLYDETSENPFARGRLNKVTQTIWGTTSIWGFGNQVYRTIQYIYDAGGRIREEKISDYPHNSPLSFGSYTTEYSYDLQDKITSIKYPVSGQVWGFVRNPLGQVEKIVDLSIQSGLPPQDRPPVVSASFRGAGGPMFEVGFHPFSETTTQPPHTLLKVGYEQQPYRWLSTPSPHGHYRSYRSTENNPDSLYQGHSASSYKGLLHREYVHDQLGRVTLSGCNSQSALCFFANEKNIYSYDPLSRLSSGGLQIFLAPRFSYTYDDNNNLTQRTTFPSNVDTFHFAPSSNRLLSSQKSGDILRTYAHDADGRRILEPHRLLAYHISGRLANVQKRTDAPPSLLQPVSFTYDHLERRIGTFEQGATTLFFYDFAGNLLEEWRYDTTDPFNSLFKNTTKTKSYVWLHGRLVHTKQAALQNSQTHSNQLHVLTDGQAKPVVALEQGGAPVWRAAYTPYGQADESDLGQNQYKEITLSTPIDFQPSHSSPITEFRTVLEAGTTAIQLFFEKCNLRRDTLWLAGEDLASQGWGPIGSYSMLTGQCQNGVDGNPNTGFWGAVIPLYSTTPEHQRLYFHLQRGGWTPVHLRVTKVRLWRVRDGFPRAETVDDAPPKSNGLYFNNANWSKSYHHAGAAMLRVCFDGFMVENFWDYVEIRDANEHIVQVLTGELSPTIQFCSSWVRGDTLKVRFSSDSSVVRTGFRIYRVESRQAQSLDLRFPGQWVVRQTEVKSTSDHALLAPPLHDNWHRFYDPDSARYLTPDPLGLRAGLNPYAYVNADPVNFVDPDGLIPKDVDEKLKKMFKGFIPVVHPVMGLKRVLSFLFGLKETGPRDWGSCHARTKDFINANQGKQWKEYFDKNRLHAWAENTRTGQVVDRTIGDGLRYYKVSEFRKYWYVTRFDKETHTKLVRLVLRRMKAHNARVKRKHSEKKQSPFPDDYF